MTRRGLLGVRTIDLKTKRALYLTRFKGFTWNPRFGPDPPSHGLSLAPDRPELWVLDAPNSVVHIFDVSALPTGRLARWKTFASRSRSPATRTPVRVRAVASVAPAQCGRSFRLRRRRGRRHRHSHTRDRGQSRSAPQFAKAARGRLGARQSGLSLAPLDSTACLKRRCPPPLPPETRTVGQLVAEALKLYGARFWPSLALGIGPALVGIADSELEGRRARSSMSWSAPWFSLPPTARAVALVKPIGRGRTWASRSLLGFVAFLPVCLARLFRDFPGINLMAVAWLAFFGLAVPAALVERRGILDALRRGVQLARADYIHALGSLADAADHHLPDRSRAVLLVCAR